MRKLSTLVVFLCTIIILHAQDKSGIKFGKVTVEDLNKKVYSIDSNASAVVLGDFGSTEIVGNNEGWFSLRYKHHKRVHILNKAGYDMGDVNIYLYSNGRDEEELKNLKAYTYNVEDGKVVETKLEKSAVFKDNLSKNLVVKKFTFPNIKEGSIIEYEYTIESDFLFNLQPWEFQGAVPRLWSEYSLSLPEFLDYVFLSSGSQMFHIRDVKTRRENYNITDNMGAGRSDRFTLTSNVFDHRWVMKDVPALKEEQFTSTIENYTAGVEFQLAGYKYPLTARNIMGSWPGLTKQLLEDEDFGLPLNKDNGWLGDYVKPLIADAKDNLEKAKNIYAYVRDNYTCTNYHARYLNQSLKTIAKSKNGSVAEINLLMTAMMRYADIQADPVLMSTKDNGFTYALYPLIDKFNYIVSVIKIGNAVYYLDATRPGLGFGKLLPDLYNGHARVVNEMATPLEFESDSLHERKLTSVLISNDGKGNLIGSMNQTPGYFESYAIRKRMKENGEETFFGDIKKAFNAEIEISNSKVDSLSKYDLPVSIKYDFKLTPDGEDIIYLNPMFGEAYKENPFKSAERLYPVEMPYAMDETYMLSLEIPEGYDVDEIPKQMLVKLNEENEGQFEYRISKSGSTISIRSRVILKRALFGADEYEMLREFFNLVVKKQNEQIVFKKKK